MTAAREPQTLKNERDIWNAVRARTPEARHVRHAARASFKRLFPEGHATSLRQWMDLLQDMSADDPYWRHIKQIHPEAFDLFVRYGVDYIPLKFRYETYRSALQPENGRCGQNSHLLMVEVRNDGREGMPMLCYVEGMVMGAVTLPMLHAWDTFRIDSAYAYDWTSYATTHLNRYLGIPFSLEEYQQIMVESGKGKMNTCLLFDRKNYPSMRASILRILENRTPVSENPPHE